MHFALSFCVVELDISIPDFFIENEYCSFQSCPPGRQSIIFVFIVKIVYAYMYINFYVLYATFMLY